MVDYLKQKWRYIWGPKIYLNFQNKSNTFFYVIGFLPKYYLSYFVASSLDLKKTQIS